MTVKNTPIVSPEYLDFRNEITSRIRSAQYEALKAVNKEMIALYWEIGKRITEQQAALGWGKSVVENLSRDIQKEFPGIKGFGVSNMWDMARFYAEYQSNEILQPLVGEISWSKHIVILTKCKETRQRQFYILATKKYGWTKDVLINKIEAKSYENYLLGQSNFDLTARDDKEPSHACAEGRIYVRPCGAFGRTFRIRTGAGARKEYPCVSYGVRS